MNIICVGNIGPQPQLRHLLTGSNPHMHRVLSIKANDDFTLDLRFDDGSVRRFDVKPYLEYEVFRELKDKSCFKKARVAFGTVQWPNEQDISPETLYLESTIIESAHL